MADSIALYTHNAYKYLSRNGVASRDLEGVLRECPIASEFNGAAYYFIDDLEAVIDVYLDYQAEGLI